MANYLRALRFPIVGWLFTYLLIVVTVKLFPVLVVFDHVPMGPGFLVIVGWLLGAWAGYKIVEFGGSFVDVVVVSAIMASVAGFLQIVEVGVLVSLPAPVNVTAELPIALYNLTNTLAGALTAGGFALTK